MNHADAAKRHRYQAEEFRTKADLMRDEEARTTYLRMADAYERLAADEERTAGNPIPQKAAV